MSIIYHYMDTLDIFEMCGYEGAEKHVKETKELDALEKSCERIHLEILKRRTDRIIALFNAALNHYRNTNISVSGKFYITSFWTLIKPDLLKLPLEVPFGKKELVSYKTIICKLTTYWKATFGFFPTQLEIESEAGQALFLLRRKRLDFYRKLTAEFLLDIESQIQKNDFFLKVESKRPSTFIKALKSISREVFSIVFQWMQTCFSEKCDKFREEVGEELIKSLKHAGISADRRDLSSCADLFDSALMQIKIKKPDVESIIEDWRIDEGLQRRFLCEKDILSDFYVQLRLFNDTTAETKSLITLKNLLCQKDFIPRIGRSIPANFASNETKLLKLIACGFSGDNNISYVHFWSRFTTGSYLDVAKALAKYNFLSELRALFSARNYSLEFKEKILGVAFEHFRIEVILFLIDFVDEEDFLEAAIRRAIQADWLTVFIISLMKMRYKFIDPDELFARVIKEGGRESILSYIHDILGVDNIEKFLYLSKKVQNAAAESYITAKIIAFEKSK